MFHWLSMGLFFVSMCMTVVLAADLDGIPDPLLVRHLRTVHYAHASIPILCFVGVFLLAVGYGVDIGERNGCAFSYFGLATTPLLPLLIVLVWWWLRRKRRTLMAPRRLHGLTTWLDRIPEKYGGEKGP